MAKKASKWRTRAAIAALAIAYVGIFFYQTAYVGTQRSLTANVEIGTDFNLVDHNGKPINEAALKGQPTALFFGLTHCPDVCPTTLYEMSGWFDALGPEDADLKAFFISVDPLRDTPELMKVYVENMSDRITGITGDPAEIARVAKVWHIYRQKVAIGEDDYIMDHTASVLLIDRDGMYRNSIAYLEDSETFLTKLRELVRY